MSEERRKILEMLREGKISVEEAEKLISALASPDVEEKEPPSEKGKPKYLRILVEPGPGSEEKERVNIRVPLKLVRAGLKLASFIPQHAQTKVNEALQEKGIDFDFKKVTSEDLEDLVAQLDDLTVEVEGRETVRIYCE
jgi:membrane peptidoglycan carboxypeptidase